MNAFQNSRAGILDIHSPTYLRPKKNFYGSGDIGDLRRLIPLAAESGFKIIQLTPIQDTGLYPSPYMGKSIFSYNPIYLDVEQIVENEKILKLKKDRIKEVRNLTPERVDYRGTYKFKLKVLEQSYIEFKKKKSIRISDFDKHTVDYAVFSAIKKFHKSLWLNWPEKFKNESSSKILSSDKKIKEETKFILFCQSVLEKQWLELSKFALKNGVSIAIDKPIYPVHDSADVWANKSLFYLNNDGSLKYASGCDNPHDPFGPQFWGHAVYQFKEKPNEVINFYIDVIKFQSKLSKVIRLDHTLALVWKYYIINPKTRKGKHLRPIKHKLFSRLDSEFPNVFFIAEDVGYINKKMIDVPLGRHNIPGFRCPQWFKRTKYSDIEKYPKLCVAATSNHDLESLITWWKKLKKSRKLKFVLKKDIEDLGNDGCTWKVIKILFESKAMLASISLRDVIGDPRRYNTPGTKNSINWRLLMPGTLEEIDFSRIASIMKSSNR